jgi:hypothetical protein
MFSFKLAAALLATCTLAATHADNFECRETTIDDKKTNNKITCRLNKAPENPVTVHFEAPGFQFGDCSITLTNDHWQEIPITVVPICTEKNSMEIEIGVRLFSEDCEEQNKVVKVERKFASCAFGHSTGDPHFHCLNGQDYKFMGVGVYDLFAHPQFQIQATQGNCFNRQHASCNEAVAIRFGNSIMAIDLKSDNPNTMKQVTQNVDGIIYERPSGRDTTHTIMLPCGSKVIINTDSNTNDKWLDVHVFLAASYKDYGGLLNQHGLRKGQYYSRGGEIVTDDQKFAKSWVAPRSDYLIKGRYTKVDSTYVAVTLCVLPGKDICHVPAHPTTTIVPALPTYVAPPTTVTSIIEEPALTTSTVYVPASSIVDGDSTTVFTASTIEIVTPATTAVVPPPVTAVRTTDGIATTTVFTTVVTYPTPSDIPTPPEYVDQVTAVCEEIFIDAGCNAILPIAPYVESCKSDCLLLKNFAMAESHRRSYMVVCRTLVGYMAKDPETAVADQAKDTEVSSGLQDNACKNDCSGNGKCTANGCTCNPGFSGMDCSNNVASYLAYNPNQNAYVANNPVTGEVFPANPADSYEAVEPTESVAAATGEESEIGIYNSAKGYSVVMALIATFGLLL